MAISFAPRRRGVHPGGPELIALIPDFANIGVGLSSGGRLEHGRSSSAEILPLSFARLKAFDFQALRIGAKILQTVRKHGLG
jgi:hypothetical protein